MGTLLLASEMPVPIPRNRTVLLAHARRHRPCHGARGIPPRTRRRARPSSQPPQQAHPGRPLVPAYGSGGFLSSSSSLARSSAQVSRSHRNSVSRPSQRGFLIKFGGGLAFLIVAGLYWLASRFHVFTRRILGHVPRLTPLAIDQQSSHRSSRGGPPGFAPARCLRTQKH